MILSLFYWCLLKEFRLVKSDPSLSVRTDKQNAWKHELPNLYMEDLNVVQPDLGYNNIVR